MRKIRFPYHQEDGTFIIQIDFTSESTLATSQVENWLCNWLSTNDPWIRLWRGAANRIVERETLRFMEAFSREPRCVFSSNERITIQLDGNISGPYWKDWMVKMMKDARDGELRLKFIRLRDLEPDSVGCPVRRVRRAID